MTFSLSNQVAQNFMLEGNSEVQVCLQLTVALAQSMIFSSNYHCKHECWTWILIGWCEFSPQLFDKCCNSSYKY